MHPVQEQINIGGPIAWYLSWLNIEKKKQLSNSVTIKLNSDNINRVTQRKKKPDRWELVCTLYRVYVDGRGFDSCASTFINFSVGVFALWECCLG